ncbi:MAG: hypothetical protein ABIG90_01655 [bacterium]
MMKIVVAISAVILVLFAICGLRNGCGRVATKVGPKIGLRQKSRIPGAEVIKQLGSRAKSAGKEVGKVAEPLAKAGAQELARQKPRTGNNMVNKVIEEAEKWGTDGKPQVQPGELQFKAGGQIVAVDPEGRTDLITPADPSYTPTMAEEYDNGAGTPWIVFWVLIGIVVLIMIFILVLAIKKPKKRIVVVDQDDEEEEE